jgi:hypothetical protein
LILDGGDDGMRGVERVSNLAHVRDAQTGARGAAENKIAVDEARESQRAALPRYSP